MKRIETKIEHSSQGWSIFKRKRKLMRKMWLLAFSFLLVSVQWVYAQDDDFPPPPPPNDDPGLGAVPVDGGLGFLLAAGVGYGVRRAYKGRKKRS